MELRYFEVVEAGTTSIVRFLSDIDDFSHKAPEVFDELNSIMLENSSVRMVLDVADCGYLPSSILGILARFASSGIETHLANANDAVVEVLEITHLNRFIRTNEVPVERSEVAAATFESTASVPIQGFYVECPTCQAMNRSLLNGEQVRCADCNDPIGSPQELRKTARELFVSCQNCEREIVVQRKSLDHVIACEHCNERMQVGH